VTASGIYGLRLLGTPRVQRSVIVIVLAVVLVFRALQLVTFAGQIQWGYDFSAYWSAARHLLDGLPIYSDAQLAGTYSPQQQYLYLYPPFLAAAVTPLAALYPADYRLANLPWAALGAVLATLVVIGVARREGIGGRRDTILLVGAAFAFPPVIGELVMGNVHLVLLGLLGGAWLALRDERSSSMGALLGALVGVATIIKIFPAVIILWFLLRRRYRSAAWAVGTIAVLAVATLPFTGLTPWLQYPQVLLNLGPPVDTTDTLAPIVWLSAIMPSAVARILVVVAMLAAVVWASRKRSEPVSYAVAVTASVLIAPALYHHYLAIFVLPLLLAFRWAPPIWAVAVVYLAMFGGEQSALGSSVWIVNRLLPTLGAVGLMVLLLVRGAPLDDPGDSSEPDAADPASATVPAGT
jgi:alpha-1,2-mannosyltransferase